MLLPRFEYEAPATLGEALGRLAAEKGEARILAGGTDLLVKMKRRVLRPRLLISLRRIRDLDRIDATETGGVRIGALTTMSALAGGWSSRPEGRNLRTSLPGGRNPYPTARRFQALAWDTSASAWDTPGVPGYAALVEGAAAVGGPIIRNRATVGGNIVNARPCADTVPALIALGAQVHLESCAGRRVLDIDGFLTGPGETAIRGDEVLTSIELPPAVPFHGSCYLKLTRRATMEVTIVGCAVRIDLEEDRRTVRTARLVFASVAPAPLRVRSAEQAIEGRIPDAALIRESAMLARDAARPIDDCRAPADFRTAMVEVLARRAIQRAIDRARRGVAS